jgi:tetratricopeptide (TPR) repeat protein
MSKLLDVVEPQIASLRRQGKNEEAARLASGVGQLLDKIVNEPNISPAVLVFLGRGLREIGNYNKAIEYLKKVPAPPEGLDKPLAELEENARLPVLRYRTARLEMARCHRLAKRYDEADAILQDAFGTKDKRGWGATDLTVRKEAAYLLEAKAAETADPKEASKVWGEANQLWSQMGREYRAVLVRPYPKDDKARNDLDRLKAQVKPIYHDLFYEQIRCVTRANNQLLQSNPASLATRLAGVARQMIALEKGNPDLSPEVRGKLADLLEEVPALKTEYMKQEGPKGLLRPAPGS